MSEALNTELLTQEEIDALLQNIDSMDETDLLKVSTTLETIKEKKNREDCYENLLAFCQYMMPDYVIGAHHRKLADLLEKVERGELDRITVSIAPRHGKSQIISIFYSAWYFGRNPSHKLMLTSHTTDLAVDFGRKVRNLIATDKYKEIFPDVSLSIDSKSAGRWNTNHGGEFFAAGVGSALAGRGAHLLLVDDPHSEQDVLNGNFEVFEKAFQWFQYGARTRLMPGGRVAIVATRWHMDDLIGRVINKMKEPDADQYHVVEFPAILNEGTDKEKALWPEFFDLKELKRTKASMPLFQWNAQYMQNPTAEEAALLKREWWRDWPHDEPPDCSFVIMSLDAAAEKHNRADFTSLTVWGVFWNEEWDWTDALHEDPEDPPKYKVEKGAHNLILLNSITKRVEFPELKRLVLDEYREREPDAFIVEKKSAGVAIYQEFRRMGLPVSEFTPHRGTGDKVARVNAISDIVSSGLVWVPRARWAEELVEECAAFPFGSHDDRVDSTVMALMRFRKGGFLRLPSDEPEDEIYFKSRNKRRYY